MIFRRYIIINKFLGKEKSLTFYFCLLSLKKINILVGIEVNGIWQHDPDGPFL
jgi:hypothetical protein